MPRFAPSVVALAAALLAASPVVAQEGTPVPLPATPAPSECLVEPRPTAFFVEVFEQTMANPPTADPFADLPAGGTITPTPVATPAGPSQPADAATVAGVTATVREFVACINAGDLLRSFSLYTEQAARDGLVFLRSPQAWMQRNEAQATPVADLVQEIERDLAQPAQPRPTADRVALIAVADVRLYPDGRVVAEITAGGPDTSVGLGRTLFAEEAGRWRIVGTAASEATPTAATPTR